MSLNPVACEVGDSCAHAARLMRDRAVGCVVVLDQGRVAGLLTDRLLTTTCLADAEDPEGTTVEHVMVRNVTCVSPEDSVFTAIDAMRGAGRARRLPVIGPRRELLGLVSVSDVALLAHEFVDAVIEEDLHNARKVTRALTGAKRFAKRIRRPTQLDRLPEEPQPEPKRFGSREGPVRDVVPTRRRSTGGRARASRWRTGAEAVGRGRAGTRADVASKRQRVRRTQSRGARRVRQPGGPDGARRRGTRDVVRGFKESQPPSQAI